MVVVDRSGMKWWLGAVACMLASPACSRSVSPRPAAAHVSSDGETCRADAVQGLGACLGRLDLHSTPGCSWYPQAFACCRSAGDVARPSIDELRASCPTAAWDATGCEERLVQETRQQVAYQCIKEVVNGGDGFRSCGPQPPPSGCASGDECCRFERDAAIDDCRAAYDAGLRACEAALRLHVGESPRGEE